MIFWIFFGRSTAGLIFIKNNIGFSSYAHNTTPFVYDHKFHEIADLSLLITLILKTYFCGFKKKPVSFKIRVIDSEPTFHEHIPSLCFEAD